MSVMRKKLRMFWGKLRRQFIIVCLSRKYIENQMARRRGHCRQCAACCNFSYPCPLLEKSGACQIYNTTRPRVCRLFPINQADIDDVTYCGGTCGYWFD